MIGGFILRIACVLGSVITASIGLYQCERNAIGGYRKGG